MFLKNTHTKPKILIRKRVTVRRGGMNRTLLEFRQFLENKRQVYSQFALNFCRFTVKSPLIADLNFVVMTKITSDENFNIKFKHSSHRQEAFQSIKL